MKSKLNRPCQTCGGKGLVPLAEGLQNTLGIVRLHRSGTASEVWADSSCDKVEITAINNRLEELRALGHLRRERDGREWRYFLA